MSGVHLAQLPHSCDKLISTRCVHGLTLLRVSGLLNSQSHLLYVIQVSGHYIALCSDAVPKLSGLLLVRRRDQACA